MWELSQIQHFLKISTLAGAPAWTGRSAFVSGSGLSAGVSGFSSSRSSVAGGHYKAAPTSQLRPAGTCIWRACMQSTDALFSTIKSVTKVLVWLICWLILNAEGRGSMPWISRILFAAFCNCFVERVTFCYKCAICDLFSCRFDLDFRFCPSWRFWSVAATDPLSRL